MHVEEVHGIDAFLQLERTWNDLCRESLRESFFVSHEWFRCCLAGLAPDVLPLVLLVHDGPAVLGIMPLLSQKTSWRVFPARTLSLMQNQDSPFADLILERSHAGRALAALLEHLAQKSGWHVWSATKIDRASPASLLLSDSLSATPHLRSPGGRSPILHMTEGWTSFWKARSQRFKKTVRNVANRVERLGAIEIIDQAANGTAAQCTEVFGAVAAKSWKENLPVSITRNAGIGRFFDQLTSTLHARGQLALWMLRLDGTPIATEYHVRDGNTVYALRSDFDERYSDASPGAHLNAFIVQTYFERGVHTYDMGPGDSDYKHRWATSTQERDAFWLFNRTPYAAALYNMERRAVPQLRRARNWWRRAGDQPAESAGS